MNRSQAIQKIDRRTFGDGGDVRRVSTTDLFNAYRYTRIEIVDYVTMVNDVYT